MSVIVKGMEMPLNCALCERWSICECLKEYKDYESILYAVDDGDLVRADECPLVEIKKPHGRLIDADELAKRKYENIWTNRLIIDADDLDDVQTVIEAEGET